MPKYSKLSIKGLLWVYSFVFGDIHTKVTGVIRYTDETMDAEVSRGLQNVLYTPREVKVTLQLNVR